MCALAGVGMRMAGKEEITGPGTQENVYVCICMYVCVYMYMFIDMYVCMYVCMYERMTVCMYVYTYA